MALRVPIGISNFVRLRHSSAVYVDKTAAIVQLLDLDSEVFLFTRPRRFGKTLLLSTLEAFLQRADLLGEDTTPLFEDLAVWRSEIARAHHQRYPVISLSFKEVSATTWEGMLEQLGDMLAERVARAFRWCAGTDFDADTGGQLARVRARTATPGMMANALKNLTQELSRVTGQRVVVLIDEYDTPLHTAWSHGFFDEALPLFRTLLGGALKDNDALFRGVLTGILRVARESLFSGFNNPSVFTLTSLEFADAFGFTQPEIEQLAQQADVVDQLPDMEAWYDGYLVGRTRIYNPWSVLHFLRSPEAGLQPHWVNSGGTALIEMLLDQAGPAIWRSLEDLYNGGSVRTEITENLIFAELATHEAALWSLLLASGYLKPARVERRLETDWYSLVIPNREVRVAWRRFLAQRLGAAASGATLERMLRAMLDGDEATFGAALQDVALKTLSHHDVTRREPERVWQAFVLGMLVALEPDYEVRSNQEAGFGRADVLVRPRQAGRPGVVMELKRLDPGGDVEAALEGAFQQIEDQAYVRSMGDAIPTVRVIAAVFEGKRVHVRIR
jgi:hypothetical protein